VTEPTHVRRPAQRPIVVAVDGPSGSGKSSVSRAAAQRLGLRYLDTGAMYRAMTWWMLTHRVDVEASDEVAARALDPVVESGTDPAYPTICVDGVDVSGPIRSLEVTAAVSFVAAVPAVRARMVELQRAAIGDGEIVVEGRDIGSALAPDADVKIFLTASEAARAARRSAEHSDDADAGQVSATRRDLERRDHLDSTRATSPLRRPVGAIEIDATERTLDEVIDLVCNLVEAARTGRTDEVTP
jgi:cytidylate kinase